MQRTRTSFGAHLDCDLRDKIPSFIFHFGCWEPNISHWIGRRLQPGDLFVDVGSNIGYYTLLASKIVGPRGKVVALEASPVIFTRLGRSLEANHCENVRAVNVAVSENPGRVTIYSGPCGNSGATSTLPGWRDGIPEAEVIALPLDQILTPDERASVRLIKIDVEGAEAPILRQIAGAIENYPRDVEILVECTPGEDARAWAQILDTFFARGFRAYSIENDYSVAWYLRWRRACALQPIFRLPSGQTDVLFTRRDILAEQQVQSDR
jgi:FkbM family methyltransferase